MATHENNQLRDTIIALEKAFAQWDEIPNDLETPEEKLRLKTRDLLLKLKAQIEDLGL